MPVARITTSGFAPGSRVMYSLKAPFPATSMRWPFTVREAPGSVRPLTWRMLPRASTVSMTRRGLENRYAGQHDLRPGGARGVDPQPLVRGQLDLLAVLGLASHHALVDVDSGVSAVGHHELAGGIVARGGGDGRGGDRGGAP